jgi:hypothetical protein
MFVVGFNYIGEPMKEVSHRDDNIIFYNGVDIGVVEEFDNVWKLLLAEVGAEAHELAVGENTDDL